ncbi:MAG TPA: DUF2231 domain-containing protein [Cytophagaceae bacterium]
MIVKIHPLIVHFPVAMLFSAGILALIGLFYKRGLFKEIIYWILLIGITSCLMGIYTGLQEEQIVSTDYNLRDLLTLHKRTAYILSGLFTMLFLWVAIRKRVMRLVEYSAWTVFLLFGSITVAYQGHLGAKMVYGKGAGVEVFEKAKQKLEANKDEENRIHDYLKNLYY